MFGRGNAPPPNSQWAKRKTSIDSCPVKKARMDIFGNPTTCKCGFHPVNVSVKVIILNYVDKKSANCFDIILFSHLSMCLFLTTLKTNTDW